MRARDVLNEKQEKFCILYAKYGEGRKAYMEAYGAKPETASSKACKLLKKPLIQMRLNEIHEKTTRRVEDEVIERDAGAIMDVIEMKERLTKVARQEVENDVILADGSRVKQKNSVKDAIRAIETLAKMGGYFITKQEVDIQGIVPVVLVDDVGDVDDETEENIT